MSELGPLNEKTSVTTAQEGRHDIRTDGTRLYSSLLVHFNRGNYMLSLTLSIIGAVDAYMTTLQTQLLSVRAVVKVKHW